jgi:hypothetical protein
VLKTGTGSAAFSRRLFLLRRRIGLIPIDSMFNVFMARLHKNALYI